MMKQKTKPDYNKMNENELMLLLKQHQQMLSNTQIVKNLPDKGERLRNAIKEIENVLVKPSTPMDCDFVFNQFSQMAVSSDENSLERKDVCLQKSNKISNENVFNNNFSEERLNEVRMRLKARQIERDSQTNKTSAKLISIEEAVRLYEQQKKEAEEYLIQQTTSRLLGNMSLTKTTFGLPPIALKNDLAYRKTNNGSDDDDDNNDSRDELGRDRAEILSDHDSDEIDYPDGDNENEDN